MTQYVVKQLYSVTGFGRGSSHSCYSMTDHFSPFGIRGSGSFHFFRKFPSKKLQNDRYRKKISEGRNFDLVKIRQMQRVPKRRRTTVDVWIDPEVKKLNEKHQILWRGKGIQGVEADRRGALAMLCA